MRFTKLSSLYSIPHNLPPNFKFLVNSLMSDLISNTFPFVVGQDSGFLVNNDTWNFVRWRFDKLMILGCVFSHDVLLLGSPRVFVLCQFFDKLLGHYKFVLYCGMSILKYFPNFRWHRWPQWFSVVRFDKKGFSFYKTLYFSYACAIPDILVSHFVLTFSISNVTSQSH